MRPTVIASYAGDTDHDTPQEQMRVYLVLRPVAHVRGSLRAPVFLFIRNI